MAWLIKPQWIWWNWYSTNLNLFITTVFFFANRAFQSTRFARNPKGPHLSEGTHHMHGGHNLRFWMAAADIAHVMLRNFSPDNMNNVKQANAFLPREVWPTGVYEIESKTNSNPEKRQNNSNGEDKMNSTWASNVSRITWVILRISQRRQIFQSLWTTSSKVTKESCLRSVFRARDFSPEMTLTFTHVSFFSKAFGSSSKRSSSINLSFQLVPERLVF